MGGGLSGTGRTGLSWSVLLAGGGEGAFQGGEQAYHRGGFEDSVAGTAGASEPQDAGLEELRDGGAGSHRGTSYQLCCRIGSQEGDPGKNLYEQVQGRSFSVASEPPVHSSESWSIRSL